MVSTMSRLPQMTLNTYVEQLKSEALMDRVIQQLGIGEHGFSARGLAGMISAQAIRDSNIIELKVQHTNPVLAADVANNISSEYLELLSENNQEQMTRSMEFFIEQKEENDKKLQAALQKLKDFNAQPRGVQFLEKEFDNITNDLSNYQSQLDMAMIEMKQLQAGVSRLVQNMQDTPRTITINKQETETGYISTSEDLNPVYVSLSERLHEREAALAEKEAQIEAMLAVTERLKGDLNVIQAELSDKKIQQDQLVNEVNRLEETSDLLAQKATQTQIAKSIDLGSSSVLVVSAATVPLSPIKPNKKLNMAVALVLGLMAAVGLAFLLEFMDNTIKDAGDVERYLGVSVIGGIPDTERVKYQEV